MIRCGSMQIGKRDARSFLTIPHIDRHELHDQIKNSSFVYNSAPCPISMYSYWNSSKQSFFAQLVKVLVMVPRL